MDKDLVFEDKEIRDQADHTSETAHSGEFTAETLVVLNGLDQQVDFQLQGCVGDGNWMNICSVFSTAASSNDYETVTDYFPCYRIIASCSATPTSGVVNVWVVKSR